MRPEIEVKSSSPSRGLRARHALAWSWLAAPLAFMALQPVALTAEARLAIMLAAVVLATLTLASHPAYRRWLAHELERERRAKARGRREAALDAAGLDRDQLVVLTGLADEVRERDPQAASRHDLEGALDQYVELALARDRCRRTLAANPREPLVALLAFTEHAHAGSARARVLERRLAAADACARVADRLDAELDALVDLIRLHAQRAAMADVPGELGTVERALAELDHADAADDEITRCMAAAPAPAGPRHLQVVSPA